MSTCLMRMSGQSAESAHAHAKIGTLITTIKTGKRTNTAMSLPRVAPIAVGQVGRCGLLIGVELVQSASAKTLMMTRRQDSWGTMSS